jgi:hypothetical protein
MPKYIQAKKTRRAEEEHWEQPFPFPAPRVKTFQDKLKEMEEPEEEAED